MRYRIFVVLVLGILVHAASVMAAEEERPQRVLWRVVESKIKPSMEKEFIDAAIELKQLQEKHQFPHPVYVSRTHSSAVSTKFFPIIRNKE